MREMIAAFDRVDADDDVRAVIVTGSGRAYCAGADLSGGGETFASGGSDVVTPVGVPRDGGGLMSLRIFECTKPVIGAINGAGGRCRRHDDAADGHPPGEHDRPLRVRLRPARDRARGRFELLPATDRRDQPGRRVVLHGPHLRRPTRRSTAASCAACTNPTIWCRRRRALAAEIADNAAPVSVALTRRMLWRMLGAGHPMEAHRADSRAILLRGRERRRQRRGHELPREAAGGVHRPGERRPPRRVPGLGGAGVRVTRTVATCSHRG